MIDTIKVRISIPAEIYSIIKNSPKADVQNRTKDNFSYTGAFVQIGVPGFHFPVNISVKSKSQTYSIFVEFSVPKMVFGTNLLLFYPEDLPLVLEKLKLGIEAFLVPIPEKHDYTPADKQEKHYLPPTSEWVFNRVDFCTVWKFPNPIHAEMYLEALKHFDYGRKHMSYYPTTVAGYGRSSSVRWYLKEPELIQGKDYRRMKKHQNPLLVPYQSLATGCLRFEVECWQPKLQQLFRVKQVKVHHLIHRQKIVQILNAEMLLWTKGLRPQVVSDYQNLHQLMETCDKEKAWGLFQFFIMLTHAPYGKQLFLRYFDKTTLNRNLKALSQANVSLRGTLTLPDSLSIPSALVPNQSNDSLPDFVTDCFLLKK